MVQTVYVDTDIARYIVDIVEASRTTPHVAVGASPRASLSMLKLSQARAAMEGRPYVVPDDVKFTAQDVLVHRLILKPEMWMKEMAAVDLVNTIIRAVPVPKVKVA
jgi:MoxR-like ATPase